MSDIEQDAVINDEARYVGYRTNNKDDFLLTIAFKDKVKYIEIFDKIQLGDRIGICGVLIGDDEKAEKPVKSAKSIDDEKADAWDHVLEKKGKIGKECVLAIQTCKDPNFIKYVDDMQYHVEDEYKRTTKEWVLRACGIASRKELDTNEEALKCFRELQACYSVWSAQKGLC